MAIRSRSISTGHFPAELVSIGFIPVVPLPSCNGTYVPGYYQQVGCGQILIDIPITQKFERQAFNISLGVGVAVPLTTSTPVLVVKDSGGNDASSLSL